MKEMHSLYIALAASWAATLLVMVEWFLLLLMVVPVDRVIIVEPDKGFLFLELALVAVAIVCSLAIIGLSIERIIHYRKEVKNGK